MNLGLEVAIGGVRGGTSILYAGLGETVSERAGVVNLGIEGSMLCGALGAYAANAASGNPWIGALGGAAAGGALALVHAFFVLNRKSNQLATGLVVLFLALGLTSLFGAAYVDEIITPFTPWNVPLLSDIPWIGDIFFKADPLTYVSYFLVPLIWWLLFRSRWGLLVRGSGERTEVLRTYGHNPVLVQYVAVVIGGVLAGIGGAQLSTAYANAWFENMVVGRGFIAVAVVIFASRQPFKVMLGSYLFGAALALSPALQARGVGINQFALSAIPYVATLVVLLIVGRRGADEAPEGLKKVFEMSPSG
ncbi:MAG: ABC transporter permease [Acidimicrobiia bacterium]